MAKAIGDIQNPSDKAIPESDVVWKLLFQFGESVVKLTSESLAERSGLAGRDLLDDFKKVNGRPATLSLNLLFRLRCRGDHADDVGKRAEWEQTQHEVAKYLGRIKPNFKKSSGELHFRPDDLQLTPLEANELRVVLLESLTEAFESVCSKEESS